MPDSLVGRTLGSYLLEDCLGEGGMGAVYRGRHRFLPQTRAIKVLAPALFAGDPVFLARFEREARIAAALDHPHIVPIYDMGEADGYYYIVMQLVAGQPLRRILDREGALAPARAVFLLQQLASALDYAHAQGVIHRDLKPSNVMVSERDQVTLVDFGIARAAGETTLTRADQLVGTFEYLAPETVGGASKGPSADDYALGVMAYELLTGRVPFSRHGVDPARLLYQQAAAPPPPPRQVRPELPVALERVLLRQLAKASSERYASATAFVEALRQTSEYRRPPSDPLPVWLPPRPVPPSPLPSPTSLRPAGLGRRAAAYLLDAFILGLIDGAGFGVLVAAKALTLVVFDLLLLSWLLLGIGYFSWGYRTGQTLGARMLRLRLVDHTTARVPSLGQAVLRAFVQAIYSMPLPLNVLCVFFLATASGSDRRDPALVIPFLLLPGSAALVALPAYFSQLANRQHQTWHDKAARTLVVEAD